MTHREFIVFGPNAWFDPLTGEVIDPQQLGRENSTKAAMAGVGATKSWEDAYDDALKVVSAQAERIASLESAQKLTLEIIRRQLKDVTDDQDLVKRMNKSRINDKSHEKYQPEIDRLTAILHEIEQICNL